MNQWRAAWKMARRDLRASSVKFLLVLLGVAAGTGALTGVRGFADAFHLALKREARTLMAADLSIRQFQEPSAAQMAALQRYVDRGAVLTRITETVSMMGGSASVPPVLVSVKAVDPAYYPFYGEVKLDPPLPFRQALTNDHILISDDLAVRLDLHAGSSVKLGSKVFTVAAITVREPDRMTGSLNVGPRVMITRRALDDTGLMIYGSRASQRLLLKAPETRFPLEQMQTELKRDFPDGLVVTSRETHPLITRALDRATIFLSLVCLVALVVGALGVATAIYAHLQQRMDTIAILKCLGAKTSQVIRIYALEALAPALLGGLGGVLVGLGVQQVFPLLLAKFFPIEGPVGWSGAFAIEGIGVAVLVSLLFTLPPLLSIGRIRPALVFRREMGETRQPWWVRVRNEWDSIGAGLLIVAGLTGIAAWLASSLQTGLFFVGGLIAGLLVLAGFSWLLLRGLRLLLHKAPMRGPVVLRQGIANLYRPGNHAGAMLVTLGIGVMFTLTIYLLQRSLVEEIAAAAPPGAPNVFLINVTGQQKDGVEKVLKAHTPPNTEKKLQPVLVPLLAVRLTSVNGRAVDVNQLARESRRFARERQVTFAEQKPDDLQIRSGAWWQGDGAEPLVSVVEDSARALRLKVGDRLEWVAVGRPIQTRVAAIHRVQSAGLGGPEEFLFNPVALKGFSYQYLGLARLPQPSIARLERDLFKTYPTITVVNAADVLSIVQQVVDQVSLVIRALSLFTIIAGVVVLASSVAGTRLRRVREAAVLKTLGARRSKLVGIFSVEFLVLGSAAGLLGGALATVFARLLLKQLLDAAFRFEIGPNLAAVALTALIAVAAGWLASLRVLQQKPLEVLRDE